MGRNTDWSKRVVVISGAASGIGAALALALAQRGAALMLCDIHEKRLQDLHLSLTRQYPERAQQFRSQVLDVAVLASYRSLAEDVKAIWGRVDVVINNAGVSLIEPVASMSEQDAHWIMGINFWGVFNGCKAFIPLLQSSQATKNPEHPDSIIVNISSIFAMVSMPTQSLYNAAKAAVRGFSDALREELRGDGVQVLCVHPGGIKTRIVEQARFGDLRATGLNAEQMKSNFQSNAATTADSAAAQIIAAIETGQTRLLIGLDAKILDRLFRLLPASASRRFSKLIKKRSEKMARQAH
jgi:NAD(P)-dependent dehydrogenase (short-subunit alcohol dehydrogenase family)